MYVCQHVDTTAVVNGRMSGGMRANVTTSYAGHTRTSSRSTEGISAVTVQQQRDSRRTRLSPGGDGCAIRRQSSENQLPNVLSRLQDTTTWRRDAGHKALNGGMSCA